MNPEVQQLREMIKEHEAKQKSQHKLDINSAALPAAYERAKMAISECVNIDECKDWSDKAQALASYARQAGDDELEQMSKRIRARAMRRCGELLKMFDGRNGQNLPNTKKDGYDHFNKSEIGNGAGLSERQIKTASRLSNIPENEFNEQIESEQVPTLTELSDQGKRSRRSAAQEYLSKPKPEGFAEAIHFLTFLKELHEFTEKFSPDFLLNAMEDHTKKDALEMIANMETWFDQFVIKGQ